MKIAYMRMTLVALAITIFPMACSTLGIPSADTFNKKWLAAQQADTTVIQTDLALVQAGTISKADGTNIEAQADNIKNGLDIARTLYATDQTAGSTKLDSVVLTLQALQTYLNSRAPKNGN